MENIKQQISKIVEQSSLNDDQKEAWNEFIQNLDDELLVPIFETIKDDESMLVLLTKNLEDKVAAMAFNETGAWDSIVEEEKKTLQNVDE